MLPVVKQASARCLKGYVHWYNVAVPRRSGGIGRRAGLKIRWCESTVSVRARPPVLRNFLQISIKRTPYEERPVITPGAFDTTLTPLRSRACYGLERKSRRNADSTVVLVPS